MAKRSEPNAQNSEINPEAHPSGARIEQMMNRAHKEMSSGKPGVDVSEREARDISPDLKRSDVAESQGGQDPLVNSEIGEGGERLRPSERYTPPTEPAEGSRDELGEPAVSPHRQTPEQR